MALSSAELRGVHALWDEWVVGDEYALSVDVESGAPGTTVQTGGGKLLARVQPTMRCRIRIHRGGDVILDERCAHDVRAVRASVRALARHIHERGPG